MTVGPPPGYEDAGRGWSFSAPGRAPEPAPTSLPDRLLRVVYALSVLLIALVAIAWLHGGEEASLNPIAEAAEDTAAVAGGRIELRAVYKVKGWRYTPVMQGVGSFNGDLDRTLIHASLHLPDRRVRFQTVADEKTVYINSPTFADELPPGKEWLAVEPYLGHDPEVAFGGGSALTEQLQIIKATGGRVTRIGRRTVQGVATTLYSGVIDMRRVVTILRRRGELRFAAIMRRVLQLGPRMVPVQVWIDDDGLLRRMRRDETLPAKRGRREVRTTLTIDLNDFGVEPEIEVPPAADSFDATPLAQAELNLFGKAYSEPVAPEGEPLSPGAFRTKVGETCAALKREVEPLERESKVLGRWARRLAAAYGLGAPPTRRAFRRLALEVFEPAVAVAAGGAERLQRIPPPAGLESDYRRYLRLANLQIEVFRAFARALEVSAYRLVGRLDRRLDRLKRPMERLAKTVGAGACERDGDEQLRPTA